MKNKDIRRRFTARSFVVLALTILVIDLVTIGNGLVDMIFLTPFGIEAIAAMGVGDSIVLLFFAFFGGVVDVYASRLARLEGGGQTNHAIKKLLKFTTHIVLSWSLLALLVVPLLHVLISTIEVDVIVGTYAKHYVVVRFFGVASSLTLSLSSISHRVLGNNEMSVWLIVAMFMMNATLNWIFLFTDVNTLFSSPLLAVGAATIVAQTFAGLTGLLTLIRHLQKRRYAENNRPDATAELAEYDHETAMFRVSAGIGLRHMNNYVAAVLPILMISRLNVGVVAAATVVTKLWTLYCRVPQATLGAAGIFIGYARGESVTSSHTSAQTIFFPYIVMPSILSGILMLTFAPNLSRLLGGENVSAEIVYILLVAFMIGSPFYLIEQYSAEILTVEQKGTIMASMSTVVTYIVAVPIALTGVLVWKSAFVSLLSSAASSVVLACGFTRHTKSMGYHFLLPKKAT